MVAMLSYKEGDNFVTEELSLINQLLSDAKLELDYYKNNKVKSYGIQATEKLWGVIAHIIRLNQYLQGLKIPKSHKDNLVYMSNFVTGKELQELRKRANLMHKRFYTGDFSYEEISKDYVYVAHKKNYLFSKLRGV